MMTEVAQCKQVPFRHLFISLLESVLILKHVHRVNLLHNPTLLALVYEIHTANPFTLIWLNVKRILKTSIRRDN